MASSTGVVLIGMCLLLVWNKVTYVAGNEEQIISNLDTMNLFNNFIGQSLNHLEEQFEALQEEDEERDADRAARLQMINEKRAKWRERLNKLQDEITDLELYKLDEDETDGVLESLSEGILDDVNNDVKIIQENLNDMKKLLDTSLDDVDVVLSEVKQSAVSRNVKVAGVVLYGGVRSACTFHADCVLAKAECRQGVCQCEQGLSFDSLRNQCTDTCPEYGATYQFTKNWIIKDLNNVELTEKSLTDCKNECERADLGFTCRSIDYFPHWKKCFLSENTRLTVPDSSWGYNGAGIHFQRDCSYTE